MADQEFTVGASLRVSPDRASLRASRREIEDALGDITVAVDTQGASGQIAAGSGPDTGPSATAGTSANEPRGVSNILLEQLDVQETSMQYLEEIADSGDVLGQAGGDGGGGLLTGLVSELAGAGAETAGDAGIEAGAAATDLLTQTLGSSLGNTIADALSLGQGASERVSVKKPPWAPLQVEDVGPLPVETPTLDVEEPTLAVDTAALSVEDRTLDVERPQLDVDAPTLEVEDVGPIPVEDIGSVAAPASTNIARRSGTGNWITREDNGEYQGPSLFESVTGTATFGATTGGTAGFGVGTVGGGVGALPGAAIGAIGGGALGAAGGALAYGANRLDHKYDISMGGGGSRQRAPPPEITVNHSPTYRVSTTVDAQSLADDVVGEVRSLVEDDLDDLRRDIEDVERDLNSLERQIRQA